MDGAVHEHEVPRSISLDDGSEYVQRLHSELIGGPQAVQVHEDAPVTTAPEGLDGPAQLVRGAAVQVAPGVDAAPAAVDGLAERRPGVVMVGWRAGAPSAERMKLFHGGPPMGAGGGPVFRGTGAGPAGRAGAAPGLTVARAERRLCSSGMTVTQLSGSTRRLQRRHGRTMTPV